MSNRIARGVCLSNNHAPAPIPLPKSKGTHSRGIMFGAEMTPVSSPWKRGTDPPIGPVEHGSHSAKKCLIELTFDRGGEAEVMIERKARGNRYRLVVRGTE
jgi:hypothetical protein